MRRSDLACTASRVAASRLGEVRAACAKSSGRSRLRPWSASRVSASGELCVDVLTRAERRDLANALLRSAWSATLARPASS